MGHLAINFADCGVEESSTTIVICVVNALGEWSAIGFFPYKCGTCAIDNAVKFCEICTWTFSCDYIIALRRIDVICLVDCPALWQCFERKLVVGTVETLDIVFFGENNRTDAIAGDVETLQCCAVGEVDALKLVIGNVQCLNIVEIGEINTCKAVVANVEIVNCKRTIKGEVGEVVLAQINSVQHCFGVNLVDTCKSERIQVVTREVESAKSLVPRKVDRVDLSVYEAKFSQRGRFCNIDGGDVDILHCKCGDKFILREID